MAIDWKVQLSELNYDDLELKAISSILESRWISMGETTKEFEHCFEEMLRENTSCLAVSSCTGALHLSLLALGVGRGDEVVIPSLTFVAAANVVMSVGAEPVLADCASFDEWNVNLESIKKVVTPKTRAIMVVHYAGFPCSDIEEIYRYCDEKKLYLIEDVAHAPGAKLEGRSCGTFGHVGCFSFFSNKNMAIGEGGMLCTNDSRLMSILTTLRSHGMTSMTIDRHEGRSNTYDVSRVGLNYRIDELRSSLGIVQLNKLKQSNERRKYLSGEYNERLIDLDIHIPFTSYTDKTFESSYHIYPILLQTNVDREEFVTYLKNFGIQTSIHYPSIVQFSAYRGIYSDVDVPVTEEICKREITLPLFPTMTEEQLIYVSETVKRFFEK